MAGARYVRVEPLLDCQDRQLSQTHCRQWHSRVAVPHSHAAAFRMGVSAGLLPPPGAALPPPCLSRLSLLAAALGGGRWRFLHTCGRVVRLLLWSRRPFNLDPAPGRLVAPRRLLASMLVVYMVQICGPIDRSLRQGGPCRRCAEGSGRRRASHCTGHPCPSLPAQPSSRART